MKIIPLILLAVALLSACEIGGNGSTTSITATPAPDVEWGNLVAVANTYEYSQPSASLEDFLALGQVAATKEAMCTILWYTATHAYAGCLNIADNGQWPATCSVNELSGHPNCTDVGSIAWYAFLAMGPSRALTVAEARLADEIRRQTYCTAPRLDGSGNPCVIS